MKTLSVLYSETRRALQSTETAADAGRIARDLICTLTGRSRESVLAGGDVPVDAETCRAVEQAAARLLAGEPLAYVLGEWEFYGLPLSVTPDVLIPRDDTCAVTALALRQAIFLRQNPRILDLCTGSGCIGLALASRIPDAKVTLADVSREALAVAKQNINRNRLSARVSCVQADALESAPQFLGKFDLIVSNPPYITDAEMAELPHSVRDYEPHLALCGGSDGLRFYRAIAKNYAAALKAGGFLCLEFGMGQGDAVCAILQENGFTILERSRDDNDRERAVLARYGKGEP